MEKELTPEAVALLDAAWDMIYRYRGAEAAQIARGLSIEYRGGLLDMAEALTGRSTESLYEEFEERQIARHEQQTAREA